jgi:hypothetical protein
MGQENSNKNYLFKKGKIGRGYEMLEQGQLPAEFFSPSVPKGYSFEEHFKAMKPFKWERKAMSKEENSDEKQIKSVSENDFEDNLEVGEDKPKYNLSSLSSALEKPDVSVRKAIFLLKNKGYEFKLDNVKEGGQHSYTEEDFAILSNVFSEVENGLAMQKAVDKVYF